MYITYKGIEAKISQDNTVECVLFNRVFKSIKGFKAWASSFSNKYLSYDCRMSKTKILPYSNLTPGYTKKYTK